MVHEYITIHDSAVMVSSLAIAIDYEFTSACAESYMADSRSTGHDDYLYRQDWLRGKSYYE